LVEDVFCLRLVVVVAKRCDVFWSSDE